MFREAEYACPRPKRQGPTQSADAIIRKGIVALAEDFPQLKKESRYWESLSQPSQSGRIGITLFHTDRGKGRTQRQPMSARQRVSILIVIGPPPPTPPQLAMFIMYPNLHLVGQVVTNAGDPELDAALKKLVKDTLEPLKQLDTRKAQQQQQQ